MTSTTIDLTQDRPAKKIGGKIEDFIVGLIFLGPIFGVFSPFEAFTNPQTFDVTTSSATQEYPVTTQVSHATFLVVAFLMVKYWREFLYGFRYGIPIIALYSLFVASALWSEEPPTTLRLCLHFFEFLILGTYMSFRYNGFELIRFFRILFALVAVISLLCVALLPQYALVQSVSDYLNSWRGPFGDKNALGCVTGLGVVLMVYCLLSNMPGRIFSVLVLLGNGLLLVKSHSATSMAATAVCSLLCGVMFARHTLSGWFTIGVSGLAACALAVAQFANSSSVAGVIGRSDTLTGRTEVWHAVIKLVNERPWLGYGLGFWSFTVRSKQNIWDELRWATPHAHDDWLDITLQVGLFATLLVFFNYLMSFYHGIRLIKWGQESFIFLFLWSIFFFIRGFTETLSVFPGSNLATLIVLAQIILRKSFVESQNEIYKQQYNHSSFGNNGLAVDVSR